MKKNLVITTLSIIVSYLFNVYAFNTFDTTKFPIEAKFTTCFGVLFMICITSVVKSTTIWELKQEIERLKNK